VGGGGGCGGGGRGAGISFPRRSPAAYVRRTEGNVMSRSRAQVLARPCINLRDSRSVARLSSTIRHAREAIAARTRTIAINLTERERERERDAAGREKLCR
jgi:hypothetical protein